MAEVLKENYLLSAAIILVFGERCAFKETFANKCILNVTRKRCNLNQDLWCIKRNDSIIFLHSEQRIKAQMTHPLDLDELVEADRMHLTYLAWDVTGSWLAVGDGGVDTDTVAWGPCEDQTLAGAGIDLMVMSCLRGNNKKIIETFLSLLVFLPTSSCS